MDDHAARVAEATRLAEARCAAAGLQLTPVRRRALEILLAEPRALGAYELLDRLRAEGFGSQPPVAYRALDFLVRAGLAHRIERLNAFVACTAGGGGHAALFLICRNCRRVIERPAAEGTMERAAAGEGFAIESAVREAEGLCAACRAAAA